MSATERRWIKIWEGLTVNELAKYLLEKYPKNFITGGDDCNLLIWGTEEADRHTPKLCSLVIGMEYDPYALPEAWVKGGWIRFPATT